MTYLASPYSHPDPTTVSRRYKLTLAAFAHLTSLSIPTFSPILHCHHAALHFSLPTDAEFWKSFNLRFLSAADSLLILDLPGWDSSIGVRWEHSVASKRGLPIRFFSIEYPNVDLARSLPPSLR